MISLPYSPGTKNPLAISPKELFFTLRHPFGGRNSNMAEMTTTQHHALKRRAIIMAAGVALFLISIKLTIGWLTGTVSVLASAVDSILDFLVSGFNLIAIVTAAKPNDDAYNYGRGKLEGIASTLEGLLIIASAIFICYQAFGKLVNPAPAEFPLFWAIAAMALSVGVTFLLVTYLRRVKVQTGSLIIEADALHYATDLLSNGGILLALVVIYFTGWTVLDPLIALVIAGYVLYSAAKLVHKGTQMLMDRSLEAELVEQIREIASTHSPLISGMHELKTRRAGDTHFVEFHLVFDEDITLGEAHGVADEIEMRIRTLRSARWVINIHLDPRDDSSRDRRLAKIRT